MPAASEPRTIHGPETAYYWWQILDVLDDPGHDLKNWREILDEMLLDIPAEFRAKTRSSVNAIVGLAIGREPKGGDPARIYRRGVEGAQNREGESMWVRYVLSDARFQDYVLARSRDRANQRP
jgi:hypothetical protein